MRSLVVVLVVALVVVGCSRGVDPPPIPTAPPTARVGTDPPPARARSSLDVTFAVLSDTHLGHPGIEDAEARAVSRLDAIAGLRGVVVTGDLTENGLEPEWERFLFFYRDRPVFENVGNHDMNRGTWIWDRVAERHGGRFYTWQWDDLHLVSLGQAPDDLGLAFLEEDLGRLAPGAPILLFFHFPLAGPFATGNWFGDGPYRDRLGKLLAGRKILGIFHGHHHARGHYVWQGIDIYKPGSVKNSAHTFAVVHVTRGQMTVVWRDFDHDAPADEHAKHW
jgi:predicted phosphodiesterase